MSRRETVEETVDAESGGLRVDRFLSETLGLFPRSQISHRDVTVLVDGRPAKLSRRLEPGEVVRVEYSPPESSHIAPEAIELDILFENDDVVVINKPAGMVVHPAAGNWHGTLAQGLMHHVQSLSAAFGDDARPGIVHRLDKDTSGVIIAAKHPEALAALSQEFKSRRTDKHYLALVKGTLPHSSDTVSANIVRDTRNRKRFTTTATGGKEAITHYRVLKHYSGYSFVSLRPKTGRTHQLRVHMATLRCPIVGDPLYARSNNALPDTGLALHAYQLTIRIPGEDEARTFTAALPDRFKRALREVSGHRPGT